MDIANLKNQLQSAIPGELYDIVPGQIVLFVPEDGITYHSIAHMAWFEEVVEDYLVKRAKLKEVKLTVVATSNTLLIDCFAGRTQEDTGSPYKVFVCKERDLGGLFVAYYGLERETLKEVGIPCGDIFDDPIILTLDPKDRPVNKMCAACPYKDGDEGGYYTEVLHARPEPGTKEEKELIKKQEDKLYSLLRECYVLDIEPDIDKVRKKLEKAINDTTDYNLTIKVERNKEHHGNGEFSVFDIYVADGEKYKLDFTSAEKAVYLTFLLYGQKGIRVKETFWEFRETCQMIYGQMPFDERCDTTAAGMVNSQNAPMDYEVYLNTLRSYLSTIRTKVARKVLQPKTAIEFAIEGYKDEAFCIKQSTPEIRKQLKKDLHL